MAKDVMAKIQDLLIRAGVTEENAKAITEKCDKEEVELKLDTEKAKEEKKAEDDKEKKEEKETKEEKEEKVEEAEGETCDPKKEPEDDAEQEEAPVAKELAKGVKVDEAKDKDETEDDEVEVEKTEDEEDEEVDESFDIQEALTCLVEMLKDARNEFMSLKEELEVKSNDLEVVKEAYAKLIAERIIAEQEVEGVEDDTDETVAEEKEDTVDKRDLLREIMAIAGKHEDNEDVRTIAKKAEKLAYANDEDKRDIIREIMAIAGKHEDDEDVRTIAKKAEKLAYDKDERANESEEVQESVAQDEIANQISEDVENLTEEVVEAPKKRRVYSAFGSINESEETQQKTKKVYSAFSQ